jgi:choice-of-anchor A domain-containing protein
VCNPASFIINGPVGSQVLDLNPSGITLDAGASLSVHITGMTSANDVTTSDNPVLNVGGVSGYTVLYEGTGGHNLQITNVSIGGNVGVGGTGHVQFSGPGTIGGRLDFSAANTGQYSNNNRSNVGPTSVNYNVSAVTTALSTVNGLSTSLGGLPGTSITLNNANQTVNESSGELQTTGGNTYRVFNVTSYSENNGDVVTISGDGSGDTVVFNFTSNNNVNLGGDVVLTGGLTPDQVIWNFASSNQNIQLNNNASSYPYPTYAYRGVILAPNDKLSVVNSSLIGRVYGGDSGDMQIVSGDNIHTPPGTGTLSNTATVSATGVSAENATATVTIN